MFYTLIVAEDTKKLFLSTICKFQNGKTVIIFESYKNKIISPNFLDTLIG